MLLPKFCASCPRNAQVQVTVADVTAEIFLRLLPLLNAQGIFTLADALTASKATYLARLQ